MYYVDDSRMLYKEINFLIDSNCYFLDFFAVLALICFLTGSAFFEIVLSSNSRSARPSVSGDSAA